MLVKLRREGKLFRAGGGGRRDSHPGEQPDDTRCVPLDSGAPEKLFHKFRKGTWMSIFMVLVPMDAGVETGTNKYNIMYLIQYNRCP